MIEMKNKRILETTVDGESWFFPQTKGLLWGWNYIGGEQITVAFRTLEEAKHYFNPDRKEVIHAV